MWEGQAKSSIQRSGHALEAAVPSAQNCQGSPLVLSLMPLSRREGNAVEAKRTGSQDGEGQAISSTLRSVCVLQAEVS